MRSPKLHRFLILCVVSAVSAIACAALIHALALNFGWDILPLLYQIPIGLVLVTLYFAMPLLAGALIAVVVIAMRPSGKNKTLARAVANILSVCGLLFVHTMTSATTSLMITQREIQEVEAFGDRLIPQLEAYKAQYGDYPETLEQLEQPGARPYFLRANQEFYHKHRSDEPGYSFNYSNPWDLLLADSSYDSTRGQWVVDGLD